MKKNYIAPSVKVAEIKLSAILAGSDLGYDSNPIDAGNARSKGASFMDDEDEF